MCAVSFDDSKQPRSQPSPFLTTHWSAVRRAGDADDSRNAEALEELCGAYWHPVYAYIRRRGFPSEDARDLTQGLFADLLSRAGLAQADPGRGRFRTFLLAAAGNYISKQREKAAAIKRGAGVPALSLDWASGEEFFQLESGERFEPERLFDRRWAHQLSKLALERLKFETDSEGSGGRFEVLGKYLLAEPEPGAYQSHALELGISVNGVKTIVRRLRLRFGAILREEVARTVAGESEVEDELRYLLSVHSEA